MKSKGVSKCFDCKNAYAHKCVWIGLGREVKGFKYDMVDYPSFPPSKVLVVRECPRFIPESKKQNLSVRNSRILSLAGIEGMTVRKIASLVQCSEFTVHKVIKELGEGDRTKKCAICGKKLLAKGNARYCSEKCKEEAGYKPRIKEKKNKFVLKGSGKNGYTKMA